MNDIIYIKRKICSPEFFQTSVAAVQQFLLFEVCCCFIQRSNIADIILVSETVPQDVPEGFESSLKTIRDGLLASLLQAECLGLHSLTGAVADIFMEGPVLQLHLNCGRGAHKVLALQ